MAQRKRRGGGKGLIVERESSKGGKRGANRGRFAAIALPRSYRPVPPRLHLACPTYIPVHIYAYLLSTCITPCALPRTPRSLFLHLAFLLSLSIFLPFFCPRLGGEGGLFSLSSDARKCSIILIPSVISNFDISPPPRVVQGHSRSLNPRCKIKT